MDFSLFVLPCYREGVSRDLACFYEEIDEAVRFADEAGWARAWVSEHHFHYYGGACPNPAVLIANWAGRTKRLRLGSGVSLLPLGEPLRIAEDFALADRLSGGRLDFGIGRGYLPHEFGGLGRTAAEATGRFREGFEIIRKAWAGEPFAYSGEHFSFDRLCVTPVPAQDPVPVWVACSRTRESFEWAGANGFNLMMNQYPMSWPEMEERFGWYVDAWDGAGHDPARRQAMMALFLDIDDTEEAAVASAMPAVQEHANLFRLLVGGDPWSTDYAGEASVFEFIAPGVDPVDLLRERTLIGTPGQIAERIERYRACGFTEISVVLRYGLLGHARAMRSLQRLQAEVIPALASDVQRAPGAAAQ